MNTNGLYRLNAHDGEYTKHEQAIINSFREVDVWWLEGEPKVLSYQVILMFSFLGHSVGAFNFAADSLVSSGVLVLVGEEELRKSCGLFG